MEKITYSICSSFVALTLIILSCATYPQTPQEHVDRAKYQFEYGIDPSAGLLLSYLRSENVEWRRQAALAIGDLEDGGIFYGNLVAATLDENQAVRDAAEQSLRRLGYYDELATSLDKNVYVDIANIPPPEILAELEYSDKYSCIPNNIIDAGEEVTIILTISNKGKGTAFDVNLSTESECANINFPSAISIGDIQPGESKKIEVKVKAGLDLQDGAVPFLIVAEEKRGYNSKTYKLNVQTSSLMRPEIVISGHKINDGNSGLASGNGNGIPENGETIELIPFVRNAGVGKAIQVKLSLDSINNDIEIKKQDQIINEIAPGQTASGHLSFYIPPTFSSRQLKLQFTATDVRGASDAKKLLALGTQTRQPVLVYKYKFIDRNGNGFLENGEEGELEITPINKGKMEARSIRLSLKSNDIDFKKLSADIERISPESEYVPLRFSFMVPRTLQKEKIGIQIFLEQQDFNGLNDTITHPIHLTIPDLIITHQILDQGNNNGILEEGETADVIVRIENVGKIDAEKVVLNIKKDPEGMLYDGVRLLGKSSVNIGRIAAGDQSAPHSIPVHIQRTGTERELPLNFIITQKDFSDKSLSLALKIMKEQVEEITVAGQSKPQKPSYSIPVSANTPPVIAIGLPRNNKRVASNSEIVMGNVVDDKGVSSIDILVNGRRIDEARDIGIRPAAGRNQKERAFNFRIPLQMGENTITIRAFDIENLSREKTIAVYRESERGQIYAAVIGINQYQKVPSLTYARNDAEAFAAYLRDNMGLDNEHLLELYDSDATASRMRTLLGTKLKRMASKPEDTVFIYYAGHGAPEQDPDSKDNDGITKYILPHRADPDDLYGTAIPMYEIATLFRRIKAERLIFISDSCFSGASGGRTILAQGTRAGNLSEGFLDRLAKGKGRVILTSSSANEVSQELTKFGHGVFTYYLLKGLKGEADVDSDGLITADEISFYLKKTVSEETKGSQTPVKKGDVEGLLIVGKVK